MLFVMRKRDCVPELQAELALLPQKNPPFFLKRVTSKQAILRWVLSRQFLKNEQSEPVISRKNESIGCQ